MKVTIKQFLSFFVIGCSAVAIDFVVYNYALDFICPGCANTGVFDKYILNITSADIAKAFGFMCGSFYTYYMNKWFTWKQNNRSNRRLARFFALYSVSFLMNILANKWALTLSEDLIPIIKLKDAAFLFATSVSVVINFVGQKIWVFNANVSLIAKVKKSITNPSK